MGSITVLFDNGEYSVISGLFDGESERALGERWNGEGVAPGFPNQGANPTWHVVSDFLAVPLLHGLLDELLRRPGEGNRRYAADIIIELERWRAVEAASTRSVPR
jgi:hypothetical protein